jgi:hypothetical protein
MIDLGYKEGQQIFCKVDNNSLSCRKGLIYTIDRIVNRSSLSQIIE